MPNWCVNTVQFDGNNSKQKRLQRFFAAMAFREQKKEKGQLPAFVKSEGYMFFIRWEDNVLYYETKYSPNTDVVIAIADHFKTGFVYEYYEPGMQIFGETTYRNGLLDELYLEQEDFDQFSYDETTDRWTFEGEQYESDHEILEILLDRKRND